MIRNIRVRIRYYTRKSKTALAKWNGKYISPAEVYDISISMKGPALCFWWLLHCVIGSIGSHYHAKMVSRGKEKTAFIKTMHQFTSRWELCEIERFTIQIASKSYSPDLKKMLQEKRFGSDGEVIAAREAYFEVKDKSVL